MFHDGSWGTVCDDLWDINDANVVCGELLLGNAQEAVNYGRLGQGSPSQPIWLSMVRFFLCFVVCLFFLNKSMLSLLKVHSSLTVIFFGQITSC